MGGTEYQDVIHQCMWTRQPVKDGRNRRDYAVLSNGNVGSAESVDMQRLNTSPEVCL